MMGVGEKTPETKRQNQEKRFSPFGYPPIPLSTKWKPTVFRCPKTPETSRTYPRLDGDPSLVGKRNTGWGT